jgi:nitrous oxidase accessory protein
MWAWPALLVLAVTVVVAPAPPGAAESPVDLQDMIDAAEPDTVLSLDAERYQGGVVIDKPLTLRGIDWPIVDAGGEGTAIEIEASDVTIEGLIIRNTGDSLDRENAGVSVLEPRVTIRNNRFENVLFGVFLRGSNDSVVADNIIGAKDLDIARRGDGIRLWESERTVVEGNQVDGGRDSVFWFSNGVVVRNNEVSNGRYGLHLMYSDDAVVEGNVLTANSVGAFLMYGRNTLIQNNVMAENFGPSGYGIGLKDMDGVEAEGNRLIGNRVGMYLDNSPWSYDQYQYLRRNLFAYNDIGVLFLPSVKRNEFSENAFIDNGEQVGVQGSGDFSGNAWSIDGVGNYWSDFAGYDADGDGMGDVPYRLEDLYSTLTDRHPELAFFSETPAAKAVDLAARMFPVLRPRPKVKDEHPLLSVPELPPIATATSSAGAGLLAVSVLLMASAAVIVATPMRRRRRPSREPAP